MTASKANSKLANAAPDGKDFQPRVGLANPHLQTLWGGLVRRDDKLAEPEAMRVRVTPEAEIICHCNWQPEPRERVTVIVVHGLEGSSRSGHVIGVANKAFAAGMNVVRMNMRNCGGTEALTPTLYHSGLGCDIAAVVAHLHESRQLERITVIGYSAGGNMTMNMLGEYANAPHPALKACAVISPAMDPEKTAYMLDEPQNYLYRRNFLQSLTRLYRRKMELYPERYPASVLKRYTSIVEFDDMISGPFSGFNGAKGLYDGICSKRFAEKVRVPVMVIHSLDDPFIALGNDALEKLHANPYIHYVETQHGGHCAFIGAANGYDGRWAERSCVEFVKALAS